MTQGGTENVMATLGQMPVYSGNTTQTVALNSLNKGDQVSLIRSGNSVIAMRVTKGSTAQSKYDMTGYVDSYKNTKLHDKLLVYPKKSRYNCDDYNCLGGYYASNSRKRKKNTAENPAG